MPDYVHAVVLAVGFLCFCMHSLLLVKNGLSMLLLQEKKKRKRERDLKRRDPKFQRQLEEVLRAIGSLHEVRTRHASRWGRRE